MQQLTINHALGIVDDPHVSFTIWQPQTVRQPWAIHVQGRIRSGADVWIYHEGLKNGYAFYKALRFKDVRRFANFIRSQITVMKNVLRLDIELRGIDYRAIEQGFNKEVSKGSGQ